MTAIDLICRDCWFQAQLPQQQFCPKCQSGRIIQHPELHQLSLAHIDCDAFYASIEKRDNPALMTKPVIVGGGKRGVVAAACYVARIHGVRSAMPMFTALKLCPDAVVIPPRMDAYREAGYAIRKKMLELTPLVEPLSIDEAFLDLSGTTALHGHSPAVSLINLAKSIADDIGVSVSVGLADNKSMAKIASDMDKPKGFFIIGKTEAAQVLAEKPVSLLYGAGKNLVKKLNAMGVMTCGDLAQADHHMIVKLAGEIGPKLQDRARGIDPRPVVPNAPAKSISAETTFDQDLSDLDMLSAWLLRLSEKVSARMKTKSIAGRRIVLKLKTHDHKIITRSTTLTSPTQMVDQIFATGYELLSRETRQDRHWRLIGIGVDDLSDGSHADTPDLADPDRQRRHRLEHAMDALKAKLGDDAIIKGRSLKINRKTK